MSRMGEAPLWSADDQRARLEELIAGTDAPAKDIPLRRGRAFAGHAAGPRPLLCLEFPNPREKSRLGACWPGDGMRETRRAGFFPP
jgi:hypothetical protein